MVSFSWQGAALNKPEGGLTADDLAAITTLSLSERGLTDISDLAALTGRVSAARAQSAAYLLACVHTQKML